MAESACSFALAALAGAPSLKPYGGNLLQVKSLEQLSLSFVYRDLSRLRSGRSFALDRYCDQVLSPPRAWWGRLRGALGGAREPGGAVASLLNGSPPSRARAPAAQLLRDGRHGEPAPLPGRSLIWLQKRAAHSTCFQISAFSECKDSVIRRNMRRVNVCASLVALVLLLLAVCLCVSATSRAGALTSVLPSRRAVAPLARRALFINLPKHVSRRLHMERLLEDMGFEGLRIKPAKAHTPWQSLVATHVSCVALVAAQPEQEYVCVFEDDAELVPELPREQARAFIENELDGFARCGGDTDLEFVKLGACLDSSQETACRPASCQSWCTHAYMLTPRAAARLLRDVPEEQWLGMHSDYAYMQFVPAPPLVGHSFTHDHTHPGWRGLFFQARGAEWYDVGMAEEGYDERRE